MRRQLAAVAVYVHGLGRKITFRSTPVKDRDVVSDGQESAYRVRTGKTGSTNDQDAHAILILVMVGLTVLRSWRRA